MQQNLTQHACVENATCVNTSKFAKEVDLANLKSDINKLDIAKLKVPLLI